MQKKLHRPPLAEHENVSGSQVKNRARAIQVGVSAALLVASTVPARAELGWSMDAGVSHTDNATLADTNVSEDTLASVGGTIDYDHETRRMKAALTGRGAYVHYLDDTFDDDLQSYASGSLVFGVVPETFLWSVEDTFGQIAIDQFQPVTPENRQNVNTFSTGPDLILRVGDQSDVKLSGRFGTSRYEDTDRINSETVEGSLSFERHLSERSLWALVASTHRVKYDAPGDPEYDQPSVYATLQATGSRQSFTIDVGVNRVDAGDRTDTNPLVRVAWNRRIAPSWTMDVHARSEYQNTSQQFVSQNLIRNNVTAEVGISEVPAAAYEGGVVFAFERSRTQVEIEGGYNRLDYVVNNGLNEKTWYAGTGISRRHTPQLEGFVNYRIEKRSYDDNPLRDDTRQRAELGLDWRVGRNLFLTGGYQYNDADSDSATNRYTVNLFFVTLSYRQGTSTSSGALED
jgi:hypothetical protein